MCTYLCMKKHDNITNNTKANERIKRYRQKMYFDFSFSSLNITGTTFNKYIHSRTRIAGKDPINK